MYSKLQLSRKYLHYYLTASNGKGHGIHSPFVFNFINNVLIDKRNFYAYNKVEICRVKLLYNKQLLQIEDFGAGSIHGNTKQRTVANIAKHAAKPKKLGQLLFRIANYYQPAIMLELGTSLGLSAAYLAMANEKAKLITCEGSGAIAAVAKANFSSLNINNIEVVQGNFDKTLPQLLERINTVDFAFIDGNHRKEPTISYFKQLLEKVNEHSIFVFDDIHWSKEMELAWDEIKNHPKVLLTVDLFFLGLVFFRNDFKVKQHFVIRH